MRIIFTGGGTAGHINPALAVADYVRKNEPNSEILYVGAKGGMEEELVRNAGFEFKGITISGFSRKLNFSGIKKNLITLKNIFLAWRQSKKILDEFKPDVCMGTGGYASGPLLKEAASRGIPFVIHEQNAFPGITTKILSKKAKKVMLASAAAQKHLDKSCDVVVVGNPIRCEIGKWSQEEAKSLLGLDARPTVLSFGGSLGARKINESISEFIVWNIKNKKYNHLHGYGKHSSWFKDFFDKITSGTPKEDLEGIHVQEYINDMPLRLAAADVVICRAGAITLSEIEAMGKPAILIPSPNVAENHQYHNAMELVNANAASIIEEKDLNGQLLIKKVSELIENEDLLNSYKENLKRMAITNADEKIYSIIKQLLSK